MLREPAEFDDALKALFTAQEQAMQVGSAAAGEHLCFIGSYTACELVAYQNRGVFNCCATKALFAFFCLFGPRRQTVEIIS